MTAITSIENQTLALGGIFQAVHLCKALATTGKCEEDELQGTLRSILTLKTDRVIDAYGGSAHNIGRGLRILKSQLAGNAESRDMDLARYSLAQMIGNLANLYRNSISHLNPRIMVSGDPDHLNNNETASTIRAALLGGIRSVVLWPLDCYSVAICTSNRQISFCKGKYAV